MRIVLCDDDPAVREELEAALRAFFAENGLAQPEYAAYASGDELLAREEFADIAFLDVEMPGISGIQAGAALQRRNRHIKVFILTSFPDYLDEAMKVRVFRYLSKPLDRERLFRNMKDALDQYSVDTHPVLIETREGTATRLSDEIVLIESANRTVTVHTVDRDYRSVQPMRFWYALEKIGCFFCPHQSFVVNLKYVVAYDRSSVTLRAPSGRVFTAFLTRRKVQAFKNAYMLFMEASL